MHCLIRVAVDHSQVVQIQRATRMEQIQRQYRKSSNAFILDFDIAIAVPTKGINSWDPRMTIAESFLLWLSSNTSFLGAFDGYQCKLISLQG